MRRSPFAERSMWHAGIAVLCGLVASTHAVAATMGSCTITVSRSGVLKASPDLKTLGTKNAGGSPGRVTIQADAGGTLPSLVCSVGLPLNCMRVSVTPPSGFSSAPAGAGSDAVLSTSFSRAGSSSDLNLLSLVILNGTHTFDVDLTATKASGMFAAGTYQAQQVIRCE